MSISFFSKNFLRQEQIIHCPENINIDETFQAEYDYGPKEEQIFKKNIIINFLQTLLVRLIQLFVYPGSCKKLDQERTLRTKNQLKSIGGKFISLKTPDRDTLEGVHIKAVDFKKSIEKYFQLIKERDVYYNSTQKTFTLKSNFYVENREKNTVHLSINKTAQQFIEHLNQLKFGNLYSYSNGKQNLTLYSLSQKESSLPSININEEKVSNPTVIISGGNQTTYGNYKGLACSYLMRGVDVMLFNPRGYGDSTGIPTSHKTKLDLETVYQYLSKEHRVKNEHFLLHGHCLGGGLSSDLTARRKGTNLLLDRSFATFRDEVKGLARECLNDPLDPDIYFKNNFPQRWKQLLGEIRNRIEVLKFVKIPKILANPFVRIISLAVDYNNEANVSKTTGNLAFIFDSEDQFIDKDAKNLLLASCLRRDKTVIFTNIGHDLPWINTKEGPHEPSLTNPQKRNLHNFSDEFNQFLIRVNLYRKVFSFSIKTD